MKKSRLTRYGAARRDFLKRGAAAGAVLGTGPLLLACAGDDAPDTALRSYFFDFSNDEPDADFFLVAGNTHHALKALTADEVAQHRASYPQLAQVPASKVTHSGIALPLGTRMRMCYVKVRRKRHKAGEWDMHSTFFHMPQGGAATAGALGPLAAASCGKQAAPASLKTGFACRAGDAPAGLGPLRTSSGSIACSIPGDDLHKDCFDEAVALICHHPEIASFDASTMAYIQQYIVCPDPTTLDLAVVIYDQGPASKQPGGWATLVEWIDPATGLPKLASNGDAQYFVQHSDATKQAAGAAMNSVLKAVKNDPNLGRDVTGMKAGDDTSSLRGAKWTKTAGKPSRNAVQSSSVPSTTTGWTVADVGTQPGYSCTAEVEADGRSLDISIVNTYDRFLGLYVRYMDLNGNPIPLSTLDLSALGYPSSSLSQTYDAFLDLIGPELVILGVPLDFVWKNYTVTIPPGVSSVLVIAGGAGHGTQPYPDLCPLGAALTAVLNLAIPGLFLVLGAASTVAPFQEEVMQQTSQAIIAMAKVILTAVADQSLDGLYSGDPDIALNLLPAVAGLAVSGGKLAKLLYNNEVLGEETEEADDCVPFGIGLLVNAILSAGTAAGIAETAAEIRMSPDNYVTTLLHSHTLNVTINPAGAIGFPVTASYYVVTGTVGTATPILSAHIGFNASSQGTTPLSFQFAQFPAGGIVTLEVSLYAADDSLRGIATAIVDNSQDFATLTIKNVGAPITATTVYTHAQVLTSANGNYSWASTTTQPASNALRCTAAAGSLCQLVGITASDAFGMIAYGFQAYAAPRPAAPGAPSGVLYTFQTMNMNNGADSLFNYGSFTSTPQLVNFNAQSPATTAYYVDTSNGNAIVRGILRGNLFEVEPTELGQSFGKFNLVPDIFLQHGTGKLIGINIAHNRFEILTPLKTSVADALAPLASVVSGTGTREGRISGAVCAAIARGGAILILEADNKRVQAFDTGGNPAPYFNGSATMSLTTDNSSAIYLDMAVEPLGYLYVLWFDQRANAANVDIYTPKGELRLRLLNMNAGKIAVDSMRTLYTLNQSILPNTNNFFLTQPTVSQWFPS